MDDDFTPGQWQLTALGSLVVIIILVGLFVTALFGDW